MTSIQKINGLNVDASVFSPMSKMKMEAWRMEVERKTHVSDDKTFVSKLGLRVDMTGKTFDYCRFCRNNGEKEEVYLSHKTKEQDGNVQCPVLRNYICPKCGESGDKAHTISYCPKRLKSIKRESEDHEEEDSRIPTPMIGHLINRMMIERDL